jgi:DNA repair protein RadC
MTPRSDTELLTLAVGSRAAQLVEQAGGLARLSEIAENGPPRLQAVAELAARTARAAIPKGDPMSHPSAVADYLRLRYASSTQEVMGALYVDTRHRIMHDKEHFRGSINRAAVEPRAILKEALLSDAVAVILFHNHPSGQPDPSPEDIAFTRRFSEAAEIVGIRLLDHLVLGDAGRYVSLRRLGECGA